MKTIILALALACAAVTAPAGRVEEEAMARLSPPSKETMARPTWATQTMSASFADTLTTQGQPRRVLKGKKGKGGKGGKGKGGKGGKDCSVCADCAGCWDTDKCKCIDEDLIGDADQCANVYTWCGGDNADSELCDSGKGGKGGKGKSCESCFRKDTKGKGGKGGKLGKCDKKFDTRDECEAQNERFVPCFPTVAPTPQPTSLPTPLPSSKPTPAPTGEPTADPTPAPTAEPSSKPTAAPTAEPSSKPTPAPTGEPTADPTPAPTAEPSSKPTPAPTGEPTADPTPAPTAEPSSKPTAAPTAEPTGKPTAAPTAEPTAAPELNGCGNPCAGVVTLDEISGIFETFEDNKCYVVNGTFPTGVLRVPNTGKCTKITVSSGSSLFAIDAHLPRPSFHALRNAETRRAQVFGTNGEIVIHGNIGLIEVFGENAKITNTGTRSNGEPVIIEARPLRPSAYVVEGTLPSVLTVPTCAKITVPSDSSLLGFNAHLPRPSFPHPTKR